MARWVVIDFAERAKSLYLPAPFVAYFYEGDEKNVELLGGKILLSRTEVAMLKEELEREGYHVVDKVSGNEVSDEMMELPEPVTDFLKFDEWLPFLKFKIIKRLL
ncbi:MAG: hypothetical protein DRP16_05300 [Candidatus Aenigmatarchaeota archaeon]|nr:MAG: hypothetical protein DRP16_05300 [Candidatus Aenigmarchaeota archaeon]